MHCRIQKFDTAARGSFFGARTLSLSVYDLRQTTSKRNTKHCLILKSPSAFRIVIIWSLIEYASLRLSQRNFSAWRYVQGFIGDWLIIRGLKHA